MFTQYRCGYGPTWRMCILAMTIALSPYVRADGLSFKAALALALDNAPILNANAARLDAAREAAIPAGALPDPQLILGMENIPTQGGDAFSLSDDFMTMERIGVKQAFPNPAKLGAREAIASGRIGLAETAIRLARLQVLRDTAMAWINRDTIEQQLARISDLETENRLFDKAIRARFAGGSGSAAELVAPIQEAALIEERRDALESERIQAIARLKRWVGEAANLPLTGSVPDWPITDQSLAHGLHRHPELDLFDPKTQIVDGEVEAAKADKIPDWALQLAYQRRAEPYSDMVSLQLSIDLPIFPESRQQPKLQQKLHERNALLAEREAALQEHEAMLESSLAEYNRLVKAVKRANDILVPLAREKVALTLAAWRGNKTELSSLIAARSELIDEELKAIALEGDRRQLAARLHFTYSEQTLKHAEEQL
ncbi:TolC family protein [Methylomonas sp. MgM2]